MRRRYVESVEVVEHDASAPAAFADTLREAVLTGAAFYGTTGRPITLRIDVDRVHFENALRALTIGDDNQAEARCRRVRSANRSAIGVFRSVSDADVSGQLAASIAIGVIGAFDSDRYRRHCRRHRQRGVSGISIALARRRRCAPTWLPKHSGRRSAMPGRELLLRRDGVRRANIVRQTLRYNEMRWLDKAEALVGE